MQDSGYMEIDKDAAQLQKGRCKANEVFCSSEKVVDFLPDRVRKHPG